jgi:hypothetical protein
MVSPSQFAQQGGATTAFFMLLLLLASCAHVCLQISPHRFRPQKEMHFWITSFIHVFCTDPLIQTTIFEEKAFQKYWMLVRSYHPVLI